MRRPALSMGLTLSLALAACGGGESADMPAGDVPAEAPEASAPDNPVTGSEPAPTSAGLLNPNDAAEADLLAVPGMTDEIVAAVVAGRPWVDMLAVDAALAEAGLDESAREEAYRVMFVPLDLNTASEAEIMLIPGVGSRMAHEFDEYRPYDAMARFRAEIGKYVDEDEVARLEQYVVIR